MSHFLPPGRTKSLTIPRTLGVYRRWRTISLCFACILGVGAAISPGGAAFDKVLQSLVWSIHGLPPSEKLAVVEIDAQSVAAIARWPWPRSNYAQVVDRLHEAGVATISFDVDFSSRSTQGEDLAFSAALARANGSVTLPTFVQQDGSGNSGWTEALPLPMLQEHSALAAVSVKPDTDGYVRRMPYGVTTAGVPRPSLSAMIAGATGTVDHDFPINFSINPASIPRYSFIDIRDGRFAKGSLRGKHVIIGATAVELGDRYAVPRFGVIPGVVIQAMAGETLLRGAASEMGWQLPLLIALLGGASIMSFRTSRWQAIGWVCGPLLLVALMTLSDTLLNWTFSATPALAAWATLATASLAKRIFEKIRDDRQHDSQTGMPNRFALEDHLSTGAFSGVLIAQICDFEKISVGLGNVGTATLVQRVGDRIKTVASNAVIYRLEDRVLAWASTDQSEVERQLSLLRTFMMSPIEVAGKRVDVKLGLGFAERNPDQAVSRTLENATLAAAQAITDGSTWRAHVAADADAVDFELSLLSDLDDAIKGGEILAYYQPKLDLRTNRIVSVEALVRWQHPVHGFLGPDMFIPLTERSDRIRDLTIHTVKYALCDLKQWHLNGHALTCAVNISARLLTDADFIEQLRTIVMESGVAPKWLTLEVTESAAMHDQQGAVGTLRSLRELGIAISMDDYGTGQSTLTYLKQLPLSELKIDRSFVQFAHQHRSDGTLVRSTVNLAHELGLKVVAEGVEDPECLQFLKSIGCDMAQGYLISRPLPAADLIRLMETSRIAA